jgi:hypothetical protein
MFTQAHSEIPYKKVRRSIFLFLKRVKIRMITPTPIQSYTSGIRSGIKAADSYLPNHVFSVLECRF